MLEGPFAGAFGGVHLLPFFHPIDGVDAGFDPIDHTPVDPRLGTWDDVAALAAHTDVMADVVVNHVSRHSPPFMDYDARGEASPYAGLFLTYDRVFPNGARDPELAALQGPRASLPFTKHETPRGEQILLWTTFTSDQIDIDVRHPEGRRYLTAVLTRLHDAGIRAVRLDAVGDAIKKAGTSCFMIPETFVFIADLTAQARALDMEVLVEVHGHHHNQIDVARQVDWVCDFALPPLVRHALYTRDLSPLRHWLESGRATPSPCWTLTTASGCGTWPAIAGAARQDCALHRLTVQLAAQSTRSCWSGWMPRNTGTMRRHSSGGLVTCALRRSAAQFEAGGSGRWY